MSVNLEKSVEYLKIQKNLATENFAEYYLCIKEYFGMLFAAQKHIPQAQNERIHWFCNWYDYLCKRHVGGGFFIQW